MKRILPLLLLVACNPFQTLNDASDAAHRMANEGRTAPGRITCYSGGKPYFDEVAETIQYMYGGIGIMEGSRTLVWVSGNCVITHVDGPPK